VKGQGFLLAVVSAVVVAAVVTGFLVLGTPGDARKETFDQKRIEDLSNLRNMIRGYDVRAERDTLPETLDLVQQTAFWKTYGRDPETGEPYGYRKLAPDRFELCATFSTVVTESDLDEYQQGWAHPAGRACFQFALRGVDMDGPMHPQRGP
jgi:hypothetical protein